jgi:hypothetical protein
MRLNPPQPIGTDRDYQITLQDDQGKTITTFTGGEPLTAVLWPGENLPVSATLAASWITPASGTVKLTISAAAIAGMTAGIYRVRVDINVSGRIFPVFNGTIELEASPGTATAPAVYCSLQDMLDHASWLEDLQDQTAHLAGFAKQRGMARDWMDNIILRSYQGGGASSVGPGGYWMNTWANRGSLLRSTFLTELLASGPVTPSGGTGLIVGPTLTNGGNPKIIRATAKYAISEVCRAQIRSGAKNDYMKLAGYFYQDAQAEAATTVAEICINGDGWGEIPIPLSVTNTRYT